MPSAQSFPVPAFYYKVKIKPATGRSVEVPCKEVSGIGVEQKIKDVKEGSVHSSKGKSSTEFSAITVKLAILNKDELRTYRLKAFKEYKDRDAKKQYEDLKADLEITILDDQGGSVMTVFALETYPTKWNIEALDSMSNKVLMESITFHVKKLTMG